MTRIPEDVPISYMGPQQICAASVRKEDLLRIQQHVTVLATKPSRWEGQVVILYVKLTECHGQRLLLGREAK